MIQLNERNFDNTYLKLKSSNFLILLQKKYISETMIKVYTLYENTEISESDYCI